MGWRSSARSAGAVGGLAHPDVGVRPDHPGGAGRGRRATSCSSRTLGEVDRAAVHRAPAHGGGDGDRAGDRLLRRRARARAPARSSCSPWSACSATTSWRPRPRPGSPTGRRTSPRCCVFVAAGRGDVADRPGRWARATCVGSYVGARTAVPEGSGFVRVFFVVVVSAFIVKIGGDVLGTSGEPDVVPHRRPRRRPPRSRSSGPGSSATVERVADEDAARAVVERIRKQHWDARHHCSAFVLGPDAASQRSSDDGEPSGTAGAPMLEVLRGRERQRRGRGGHPLVRRRAARRRRPGPGLRRRRPGRARRGRAARRRRAGSGTTSPSATPTPAGWRTSCGDAGCGSSAWTTPTRRCSTSPCRTRTRRRSPTCSPGSPAERRTAHHAARTGWMRAPPRGHTEPESPPARVGGRRSRVREPGRADAAAARRARGRAVGLLRAADRPRPRPRGGRGAGDAAAGLAALPTCSTRAADQSAPGCSPWPATS